MKRLFGIGLIIILILTSCGSSQYGGELVGVQNRKKWFEPQPYHMAFIPQGSYNMGPSDQDVAWAMNSMSKTVTLDAFWMDETEITNNEYRQFVHWVRDSIMRQKLCDAQIDGFFKLDGNGDPYDPPRLDWETEINTAQNPEITDILEEMYYPPEERFFGKIQLDIRKLDYSYFWIDMKQASKARWNNETQSYEGNVTDPMTGESKPIEGRQSFIFHDNISVYPDTLVWISDYTYAYNEPQAKMYFYHPAFDEYPVVGVTWSQANAFSIWRTQYLNSFLQTQGEPGVQEYKLPTEAEWEYAARGGLDFSMYPWGGLYTRNDQGCFLANFKPLRGRYTDDGAFYTNAVASYEPNEFGLYDMAGNVAEWTLGSYDESSYAITHDMNPIYTTHARPDDPIIMKRKVIRGGSWKDIAYYLQTSTRTYEYQDSAKSYIGFRNIRPYMGFQ